MRKAFKPGSGLCRFGRWRFNGLRDCRGATALEFALISPLLIMMLGGIIDYGNYFATAHAVQQTVNDAARAALAGVTAQERLDIARTTAADDLVDYAFLTPGHGTVSLVESEASIEVTLQYVPDGGSFELMPLAPGLPGQVTRTAVIVRGGY
jgi:Flp pilus assembly protein TadG